MQPIKGIWLTETDLYICGTPVALTVGQHRLFAHMVKHPGRIFTRSELDALRAGQPYERVTTTRHSLDRYVGRLRGQIHRATGYTKIITTVRSIGYQVNRSWYDLEWHERVAVR